MDPEERRSLVHDVAGGLPVSRAAEKYGISPAAAWNLVNREALRLAFADLGFKGYSADKYLQEVASNEATLASLPQSRPSQDTSGDAQLPRLLVDAARAAAAALERLAQAAGSS